MSFDRHARSMLPIPDRPASGLMTYDAKDPDTAFPPIEPLLPPAGAPNVLIGREHVRRPVRDPDGGPLGRGRPAVQPFPYHGVVCTDAGGDVVRSKSSLGRDGQHHRDGNISTGEQFVASQHEGASGDDVEVERVFDGAVR